MSAWAFLQTSEYGMQEVIITEIKEDEAFVLDRDGVEGWVKKEKLDPTNELAKKVLKKKEWKKRKQERRNETERTVYGDTLS